MAESFIPAPHEEERVRAEISGYDVIAEYRERINEKLFPNPVPYEIPCRHDPEWKTRLLSIQSAHDGLKLNGGGHWFWTLIGVMFLISQSW